jgi:hypothetical protein
MHGNKEDCIQGFGVKIRRKESIRKTWTQMEDNIKTSFREIV